MINPFVVSALADLDETEPRHGREVAVARENRSLSTSSVQARIPRRYADAAPTHPDVAAWVRAVVEATHTPGGERELEYARIQGPSLLICGPTGTGKTHQSYGAIRALSVSGLNISSWQGIGCSDLYAELRPRPGMDTQAVFDTHARAAVLLLDDIGLRREATDWTHEIDHRLINRRYNAMLPTIVTTNLTPARLVEHLSERVASRLLEMCTVLTLKGDDRRIGGQR